MKTYARIYNGAVAELFETRGDIAEMFHPSLVWVEAPQGVEIGYLYDEGVFSAPETALTAAEIEARKVALVQSFMDAAARSLRYDSIANAITYADEPAVPKFQSEGQAFRAWRSLVWARCYEILADVEAGERDVPSDGELIDQLPRLQLPGSGAGI